MPIDGPPRRSFRVTREHLDASRATCAAIDSDGRLQVTRGAIDALIERSTDRYHWHVLPGATYRESAILRERMESAGIDPEARLAHGALGLIFALQSAFLARPHLPIRGIDGVRYVAPVFEGSSLASALDADDGATTPFRITTNLPPRELVITGTLLHGATQGYFPHETNLPERQLFTLEEVVGLISAMGGMWIEERGGGILYVGQRLELSDLVEIGDDLEASGEVVERRPGRRTGERITLAITVDAVRDGKRRRIAEGESIFLYME